MNDGSAETCSCQHEQQLRLSSEKIVVAAEELKSWF